MTRILLFFMIFFQSSWLIATANIEKIDLNLHENELAFTFLELSTGEASIIQTNNGETILINTGGPKTKKDLIDRFEMYNVTKIDTLILTNMEKDYTGNLKWLLNSFPIKEIVVPIGVKEKLEKENKAIVEWQKDETYEILPKLTVKVLYSNKEDETMVLHFNYGDQQILYMGKSDETLENKISSSHKVKAQILKVGDFALKNGTSPEFIERVNPHAAIIFKKHRYMPRLDIMERLNETYIDTYYIKQFGNVTIKLTQKDYEVITIPSSTNEAWYVG